MRILVKVEEGHAQYGGYFDLTFKEDAGETTVTRHHWADQQERTQCLAVIDELRRRAQVI